MPRSTRRLALIVAMSSLGLAGCWTGVDAQTSQPYTPTNAANASVGDMDLRGIALLAGEEPGGTALLVGNFIDSSLSNSEDPDAEATGDVLETVAVDSAGPVSGPPLEIEPNGVAIFGVGDDKEPATVAALQVPVGSFADVAFVFERAGIVELEVPVVPVSAYPESEEALAAAIASESDSESETP